MTSQPVAGYPSKKHAVFAFIGQGKSDAEILLLTGTTPMAMAVYRSQHKLGKRGPADPNGPSGKFQARHKYHPRHEPALPPEQKVDEAEPARAGLVDLPKPEPPTYDATVPPRTGSAARKDAGLVAPDPDIAIPITPKPEPKPMMVMKLDKRPMDLTGDGRFVTLKARSGAYLALDGSRLIEDKRHAYRGTPQQAQRMRENTDPAWGLQIIPYSNQKG